MPRLRKFFQAMAEDLFNFNILTIPFAFILGVSEGSMGYALTPLLFLPLTVYMYFLRLKIKKFTLFLFLTWLPVVIGLLTPHRVIYTAFIAFLCSYSVRKRTNGEFTLTMSFEGLCFPLAILAAAYIFSDYLNVSLLRPVFYFQAMAVMLLAIIYTHLKGINSELELTSCNCLQPTKVITAFANKYLFTYLILFVAVLLLFRYVPFGKGAIFILHCIVYLLRWIFSSFGDAHDDTPSGTALSGSGQDKIMLDGEPLPRWMQIIEQILVYTVNIIILLIILAFIVLFFIKLYRGFYSKRHVTLIYKDEVSEITSIPREKGYRLLGNRIANPIRRKYFKKVNKYFKKHILKTSLTPKEIEAKLKDKENLKELTALYEKERYSK